MNRDLKRAWRALWRRPAFSLVVVLTLALGIGGGLAVYSVVDAVLLRPLPFPASDRLVEIFETVQRDSVEERAFAYPDFLDLDRRQPAPRLAGQPGEPVGDSRLPVAARSVAGAVLRCRNDGSAPARARRSHAGGVGAGCTLPARGG